MSMDGKFPQDFKWGVSASAFQFEMGDRLRRFIDPNTDWWHWVRDPKNIAGGIVSGDLPEDGVNYAELYPKDHEIAQKMGLKIYRLTIEWSRIFPCSTAHVEVDTERDGLGLIKDVKITEDTLHELDQIANKKYVEFYRNIIQDLRSRGFKVIGNLLHFTLPIWLHDPISVRDSNGEIGPRGYMDETFIMEFTKFAAYVAWKFGDLIDMWSTFNEPMVMVELGYLSSFLGFPPGILNPKGAALALRNQIIAHARAFDVIKTWDKKRADKDSQEPAWIGVIHNIIPPYPLTKEDSRSCEIYNKFHNTVILDAWTKGKFSPDFEERSEVKQIHLGNRLQWLGVNYYTRIVTRNAKRKYEDFPLIEFEGVEGYGYACVPNGVSKDARPCSDFGWEVYPEGFLDALNIAWEYRLPIYVTENGIADFRDTLRPLYIVNHLIVLEEAIKSGIDVRGYMHWALTDNYEWAEGFRMRFGLYEVDLITKERRSRKSADIYKKVVENNGVSEDLKREYMLSNLRIQV